MAYFQHKPLDHGCFSPLSMLWPHEPDWPGAIIPLQVGVLLFPIPSALRCYKLGVSLRNAIESYPEDLKVVIVATGGLSHQVHGERAGFNNPDWDRQFLDLIENDPMKLTRLTHADYARLGGLEGAEVISWLIMRGALSANIKKVHQTYYLPTMTGLATAIYEDLAIEPMANQTDAYRAHLNHQLAGIEELKGTYPFDLKTSVRAYRLNQFLHRLIEPDHRHRFLTDPEAAFEESHLTAEERGMVRGRMARHDPLRCDLLHAGETGRGRRRFQPAHLCSHARTDVGGVSENSQCSRRALFRRRYGLGATHLGHAAAGRIDSALNSRAGTRYFCGLSEAFTARPPVMPST
jgi:gallate dioxygenase